MPAEDVTWALVETAKRAPTYKLHRDYYDGCQRLLFATERFESVFGQLFKAFADNLSAPVVDALADRLQLEGFDGAPAGTDVVADLFGTEARFRRLAGEVTLEQLRCADAFVIGELTPDGEPVAWPQQPETMAVDYSDEVPGRITRAAKVWLPRDKRWRVTVYLPDVTERWQQSSAVDTRPDNANTFELMADVGETVNTLGRPPVVHFANNGPIGGYGRSELADVIPLQDALNKTIADMLVGSEFAALPQRYAIGVEEKRDPSTGRKLPMFRAGVDRLWHVSNSQAQFGQFPAADLSKFLEVQDSFRAEIARVSGTPLHYFQIKGALTAGMVPSGVALDRLEGRLNRKAEDRQNTGGETWVELVNLLRELTDAAPIDDLTARWSEASNRDETAELDVAQKKVDLGVPLEVVLVEMGYTEDRAKEWAANKAQTAAAAAAAALASFDRGGGPVTVSQGATIAAGA